MADLSIISNIMNFVPSFNAGEIVFLLTSALITAGIIYFWMKVFHEPPHPAHAFGVALIANFQNLYVPFLISYALPFLAGIMPAQYVFHLIPLLVWVALLRIFYGDLDIKHAVIIAALSYGTHVLLQGINLAGYVQSFMPV